MLQCNALIVIGHRHVISIYLFISIANRLHTANKRSRYAITHNYEQCRIQHASLWDPASNMVKTGEMCSKRTQHETAQCFRARVDCYGYFEPIHRAELNV